MACDKIFGPRVDLSCRPFDFTLYFEDVVLASIPAACFLLLFPASLVLLSKKPKVVESSRLLAVKLTIYISLLLCQVVLLILRSLTPIVQTQASVAAETLCILAITGAGILSWFDHQRSIRPSTLLVVYLSVAALLGLARLRTFWTISGGNGAISTSAMFSLQLGLTALALTVESMSKHKALRSPEDYSGVGSEPFSGLGSRTGYLWLLGTVRQGYRRVLSVDDLPALEPKLRSRVLHNQLGGAWAASVKTGKYSLLKACLIAYSGSFVSAAVPRLCLTGFTFAQPFMINTLTDWIRDPDSPSNTGNGIIGAYALVYLGMAASTAMYWYQAFRFLTRLRAGLISMVYDQTVHARAVDLGDISGLTLMGTDVERIVLGCRTIHEVWASLLEMIIALYLLERQLQVAFVMPGLLTLAFSLTTFKLSSLGKSSQKQWIERVEKRLSITSSMLGDIRPVKMLGVSGKMFEVIDRLQRIEVETSRRFRIILIAQIFFSNAPAALAPVVTFALYVGLSHIQKDDSLLASRAFTSLALISLITSSALIFIQSIPSTIQSLACFERIQDYCRQPRSPLVTRLEYISNPQSPHTDDTGVEMRHVMLSSQVNSQGPPVLSFSNQSFAWAKGGPPVLTSLNCTIESGRVTAIVGPTGSGKSALLQSIVEETISLEGRTDRRFSKLAYCPQVPWLTDATVMENVIGASPLDEKWYASVLHACALSDDIARLSQGSQAKVGSNGSNLSGGQRQRVSLARAVYSRYRLVLLDDTFSGLDSRTVDLIARRLFGKQGLFALNRITVIIATHSALILNLADDIVLLDNGRVLKTGRKESMLKDNADLAISMNQQSDKSDPTAEARVESNSVAHQAQHQESSQHHEDIDAMDPKRQQGDWSVYSYYFKATGWFHLLGFLGLMVCWTFCEQFSAIWLKWWSDANQIQAHQQESMYLGTYAGLGVSANMFMGAACWVLFINMISQSMRGLHTTLLSTTLRAPLYFFNKTDIGSITNRFSQDMELVGMDLPLIAINYASAAFNCIAQVLILGVFTKYLSACIPFVLVVVILLQKFYLRTSRQIRLLDIEAKAPLFLHFIEAASGAATIRAYGWQKYFQHALELALDRSQRPVYMLFSVQRWLALVLDLVVAGLAILLVAIVVTWRTSFDPGSVGLSLVMVMTFNKTLMSVVRFWTMLETSIGAVSRIKKFAENTESEESSGPDLRQANLGNWLVAGEVKVSNLTVSHCPSGQPVLKGISVHIQAGERVAICGQSGCGKTSLVLSLLQMTSVQQGSIEIDGVDTSHLMPDEMRKHINVVPQDLILMPGTVRFNMDPYGNAADADIISALRKLQLWERIERAGCLDASLEGGTWSAGERQLLCLARAMVRKSKLLILDEAMSNVDRKTASIMEDAIANEFPGCTVLSVTHRLETVRRFTKALVLHRGEVMEYGDPEKLLAGDTRLSALYKAGGFQ